MMIVRTGFRGGGLLQIGAGIVATFACMFAAFTAVSHGKTLGALLIGALSLCAAGYVIALVAKATSQRDIAVITARSITFCAIPDPRLQEWSWQEVHSVEAIEVPHLDMSRKAVIFYVHLRRSSRADALMRTVPNDPTSFRVGLTDTPAPGTISDYMRSVAPRQCAGLVTGNPFNPLR